MAKRASNTPSGEVQTRGSDLVQPATEERTMVSEIAAEATAESVSAKTASERKRGGGNKKGSS